MRPVAGLVDQWGHSTPTATEDDGGNGHALRILSVRGVSGVVAGRDGEARIGMRSRALGLVLVIGTALPVSNRGTLLQALPPGLVVCRQRHVGEQRVAADHVVGVAIGFRIGARGDTKVARLRIDGPQPAISTWM